MHRFALVILVICSAWSADPQQPWRIAMVLWRGETEAETGFREYLSEHHAPVAYTVYDCGRDENQARTAYAAINRDRPDLVYIFSTAPVLLAMGRYDQPGSGAVSPDLPVVFTVVGDAVGAGIVPSLTGHGRNLTGVSHLVPLASQLPVLRSTAAFTRLGFIHDGRAASSLLARDACAAAGREQGFSLVVEAIDTSGSVDAQFASLDAAVARMVAARPDAVYIPSDSFVIPQAARIAGPLTAAGIPTFAANEESVRTGGALLGVVGRYRAVGRFAAAKALRILRDHVPAADLPIEPLPRYGVVLNIATAHRLQVFPPLDILNLAEVVGNAPNRP